MFNEDVCLVEAVEAKRMTLAWLLNNEQNNKKEMLKLNNIHQLVAKQLVNEPVIAKHFESS